MVVKVEHKVDEATFDAEGSIQYFGVVTDDTDAAHEVFTGVHLVGVIQKDQLLCEISREIGCDPQRPSDLETHDSSLHQQAMCAGHQNDEKIKPTIELADDKLHIYVGGLSLFLEQSMEDTITFQQFQFSTNMLEKLMQQIYQLWPPTVNSKLYLYARA